MTLIRLVSTTILVLALVACAPRVEVHVKPAFLPVPQEPVLPAVKAADVQCLSPAAYTALVEREQLLRTWALKLKSVLDANNSEASGSGQT